MSKAYPRFSWAPVFSYFAVLSLAASGFSAELLPPGFRPLPLGAHALVGGKIVTKPGEAIESGTIVIRDGLIKAVGKDVTPPPDARVWDMKGTTIYAGFIDAYLVMGTTNGPVATSDTEPISAASFTAAGTKFFGVSGAETDMGNPGPGHEVSRITPEHRAVRDYSPKDKTLEPLRELGFTTGVIAPAKGIIRGTSALVALVEENPNDIVLKPDVRSQPARVQSRARSAGPGYRQEIARDLRTGQRPDGGPRRPPVGRVGV